MSRTGEHLYRIVQAYSALKGHRTGTPGDQATIEWFANELVKRGAKVDQVPYRFERYVADCRLTAGGSEVKALSLYYAAVGQVNSSHLHVAELAIVSNINAPGLDEVMARARRSGADAAVLATTGAGGRLFALNRAPTLGSGFPAVLAPGSALQLLRQSAIHLELDARLEEAESVTVVGYLGQPDSSGFVVVTTSLSGWFRCAGERGTGIAICLHLAEGLAERWPVMVVGTTGHEFYNLGLRRFLADHEIQPSAVIHLGASVAAGTPGPDGSLTLAPSRWAQTTGGEGLVRRIEAALTPALLPVRSNPRPWMGEVADWVRFGVPLLSLLGPFPLFHTPDDLPERATSPQLLGITSNAASEAAQLFLDGSLGE